MLIKNIVSIDTNYFSDSNCTNLKSITSQLYDCDYDNNIERCCNELLYLFYRYSYHENSSCYPYYYDNNNNTIYKKTTCNFEGYKYHLFIYVFGTISILIILTIIYLIYRKKYTNNTNNTILSINPL